MKIQKQTSSQLILSGIPGSFGWMLVLTFLGLLLITVSLVMVMKVWNESDEYLLLLPLVLCSIFGVGFVWIGIAQLKEREHLILDKINHTANYISTTPYLFKDVILSFEWNQIESIEMVPTVSSSQSTLSTNDASSEPSQIQLVLNLNDPKQQIVLEIAQNNDLDRLNQIAQKIAGFLDLQI